MSDEINRQTFDGHWLSAGQANPGYSKFAHRPVEERDGARAQVRRSLCEAVRDHHLHPEVVEGALARRGFEGAVEYLLKRLPIDGRTRTGNFGEVFASEHLRQRYGYDMPVFKLRYMEHTNMPMRGEDVVAFRLRDGRVIIGLCVGEVKTAQAFDSREVEDAHSRLQKAYHPHPISLAMISNILHERGGNSAALAEQVDEILESLGTKAFPRDNWIFMITGNEPRDPFSVLQNAEEVVENLTCVNLHLRDLGTLVHEVFDNPLGPRKESAGAASQ